MSKPNIIEKRINEARQNGQFVRATSWSPKGERKNSRKNRRNAKADLRKY